MAISNAIDASAVARVVGVETIFRDDRQAQVRFLPQMIALIGQGNSTSTYPTTPVDVTSALEVAQLVGFGSPLHEAAKQLFPLNGDGVRSVPVRMYPLQAGASAAAAAGDVTFVGTSTRQIVFQVRVGGVLSESIVVPSGTAAAAMGALVDPAVDNVLDMPVTSAPTSGTDGVDLTAKWLGVTGNDIGIELINFPTDAGLTATITAMAAGAVAPDVTVALNQVGTRWESMLINAAAPYDDATTNNAFMTWGEGRWLPLGKRQAVVFNATSETDRNTLITHGDTRRLDRINVVAAMPGCKSTPWAMAAREVARVALTANNRPARDYGSQVLSGLIPGTDAEQFEYTDRDLLVKAGISTTEVRNGAITISDTVTYYHPEGDPLPAYRFVKNIVKLQQTTYNVRINFETARWDGAPLLLDTDFTTDEDAVKPKTARATAAAIVDGLADAAIVGMRDETKSGIRAQINTQNPDRLDLVIPWKVSGNANQIAITQEFSFIFGTAGVAS